jgi:hypothetical protein
VASGTRFEIRSNAGRTTVAVEEDTVTLHAYSHIVKLAPLQTAVAGGDGITPVSSVMLYEIATWKFRQDDVPDGAILFKEDFEAGQPKLGFVDIAPVISENQGVGQSRCLQFDVPYLSKKNEVVGYIVPRLAIRHKNFDITFSYRWSGYDKWLMGPWGGYGTSADEEFSWWHSDGTGEKSQAQSRIISQASIRKPPENEWLDVSLLKRDRNMFSRVFHNGQLCYKRESTGVYFPWMAFIFGSKTTQEPVTAYIDNIEIKKASSASAKP